MTHAATKHCVVAYAVPERQLLIRLELPADASIAVAIEAARRVAPRENVPWDSAPVGIFGEIRERSDIPQDGDRIELYRALSADPRARRRERTERGGRRR